MPHQTTMTPPAEYICPLSKTLMKEPMMSRYGTHFERKAILEWINQGHNYCPVTGNTLRPSNLVSNKTLQWKIKYWALKNGVKGFETEEQQNEKPQVMATAAFPPKHMLCPLTHKVMEDPVMTREGQNFERKAILSKLDKKGNICPVTKKPLRPSGIVGNGRLQWEIRKWQLNHGDVAEEMTRLELGHSKLSKAEMVSLDFQLSDILRALTFESGKKGSAPEKSVDKLSTLSVLKDALECF